MTYFSNSKSSDVDAAKILLRKCERLGFYQCEVFRFLQVFLLALFLIIPTLDASEAPNDTFSINLFSLEPAIENSPFRLAIANYIDINEGRTEFVNRGLPVWIEALESPDLRGFNRFVSGFNATWGGISGTVGVLTDDNQISGTTGGLSFSTPVEFNHLDVTLSHSVSYSGPINLFPEYDPKRLFDYFKPQLLNNGVVVAELGADNALSWPGASGGRFQSFYHNLTFKDVQTSADEFRLEPTGIAGEADITGVYVRNLTAFEATRTSYDQFVLFRDDSSEYAEFRERPTNAEGRGLIRSGNDVVGFVSSLNGDVLIERPGVGVFLASEGVGIEFGDIIDTSATGTLDIEFDDGTKFKVDDNTRTSIDEFAYDPASSDQSEYDFNVMRGVFRYTSGLIGREKPEVEEYEDRPSGGIRGDASQYIAARFETSSPSDLSTIVDFRDLLEKTISFDYVFLDGDTAFSIFYNDFLVDTLYSSEESLGVLNAYERDLSWITEFNGERGILEFVLDGDSGRRLLFDNFTLGGEIVYDFSEGFAGWF